MKSRLETVLRPAARLLLPALWRMRLRRWWYAGFASGNSYDARLRQEVSRFSDEEVIHDLPPICDYWSEKYLRPLFEQFGFSYPEDFFARQIERKSAAAGRPISVVSIGAGNGESEAVIAKLLLERGVGAFTITCLDFNDAMLERGRRLTESQGIANHFRFVNADFNRWKPAETCDVVIANQSLHHVTNLEGLFDAIHEAIGDDGIFVTSDMIGRNGHRRWPEALAIVQEFWQELPTAYRYNRQLHRNETRFGNWDCAAEGFEGIRAQDILPLALAKFGFDMFLAYGNLIDPFVDRSFGPNFDAEKDWDRDFIDRVHARDEAEMLAGTISPTHMLAVMRRDRSVKPIVWRHLTPEFCLRRG
jgi:SAM-dependent methyltransferase